ncbi:ABC transporter ATP-binding protein [Streptomyces sp. SGAir0957]
MIQAIGLTSNARKGRPPAVDDVSFDAQTGRVTALLGDRGAGKTTAVRLMLELQQGRGTTYFRGRPLHRLPHPVREVGVLLGDVPGHPARTVRGHLRMFCAAAGVPVRRADEVLEVVGLVSLRDERLGTLSRGMDRRLGLACALLADPHTLVLDGPADGLSLRENAWLHGILRAHAGLGGTILITTDDPKEAARTADRVVTLVDGRVVADQDASDFARTRLRPRVAVRSPYAARLGVLLTKEARTARRTVEVVAEDGSHLSVYGSTCAEVGETAFRHGILVHQIADETGDTGLRVSQPPQLPQSLQLPQPPQLPQPLQTPVDPRPPSVDPSAQSTMPGLPVTRTPEVGVAQRSASAPPATPGQLPASTSTPRLEPPQAISPAPPTAPGRPHSPARHPGPAQAPAPAPPTMTSGSATPNRPTASTPTPGPKLPQATPPEQPPALPVANPGPTTPTSTFVPLIDTTPHPGSADRTPSTPRSPRPATPLSPLPPPITVRPARSPLRPVRYELRRVTGVATGYITVGLVLVVSAVLSVLLARVGHTPQPRLLAAWPRELPLPPAALGAGLLGAFAFGDEFRHPALAADRGTVPRRLGLLAAKLLVSAATAVLMAGLVVSCDAALLHLVYGSELTEVPADLAALTASWLALLIACGWAGVLASGVFRSTAAGLAAVVAVPIVVVPFVQKALAGPSVRTATGLPARLRDLALVHWPFGVERIAAGAVRLVAQPVGGAMVLSLGALLCAYLLMVLRPRVR